MGMEACGGAHHWAREIGKLGHEVRIMAPQPVTPYPLLLLVRGIHQPKKKRGYIQANVASVPH